jgi:hypothetical protein
MSKISREYAYEELIQANLVIDAVYQGKRQSKLDLSCEPLTKLLPGVGNMGGFRKVKNNSRLKDSSALVLMSTGSEPDWPDSIDIFQGTYTYHGDNRAPGTSLHETPKKGNTELRRIFSLAHGSREDRESLPLILIFEGTNYGHDVIFRGLAVPGASNISPSEDLIAVWAAKNGKRFQNYKAIFTILNTGDIDGEWIREIFAGKPMLISDSRFPNALKEWVVKGKYSPLKAAPNKLIRNIVDQTPSDKRGVKMISKILEHCASDKFLFEAIAKNLWEKSCSLNMQVDLTRRWRDGGRDAMGYLLIGPKSDPIKLNFAIEAKCYSPGNNVGVKEMSRLISRLKHREFGVMVTTSAVSAQAYEEIRTDGHPIVVISANDIVEILINSGIKNEGETVQWLRSVSHFPN